jgi:hypothetical protein
LRQTCRCKDPIHSHREESIPCPYAAARRKRRVENRRFFDVDIKKVIVAGKTFSADNDFDKGAFYGKSDFADQVVAPHAKAIDFRGFKPLLQSIAWVIQEHVKTTDRSLSEG